MATISNHKHQVKSRAYGPEEIAQMAQRLNAISFSMGFGNVNATEVFLGLSQWIKEQFGDMSMQDVALAFDLVTAKKIGANIRHYNSFSKQYIGEVLSAFREFRSKQIKLHKESEDNKRLSEHVKTPTGEEMYNGIKKIAIETGKIMRVADWTGAYNYAWKENLIHRMSEKERQEYKDSVIEALKSEKRGGVIPDNFNIDTSLQSECHRRILQAHFQEIIDSARQRNTNL